MDAVKLRKDMSKSRHFGGSRGFRLATVGCQVGGVSGAVRLAVAV